MRTKTAVLIAVVVFVLIGLTLMMGVGIFYAMYSPDAIASDSILHVSLSGTVAEFPPRDGLAVLFAEEETNLWDLRRVFLSAADDDRIQGAILEIGPLLAGWAQIEEIRGFIQEFRNSGKQVHAFLATDMADEAELFLASACDSITINPAAGLIIDGLAAEVIFMKRMIEKLGLDYEGFQLKEYKGAQEFTRTEMTPEIREMLTSVLGNIQNHFVSEVAEQRTLDPQELMELIREGMIPADRAAEAGLVDHLGYRREVLDLFGEEEYEQIPLKRYVDEARSTGSGPKVAVIEGSGMITAGESESFVGIMGGSTLADQLRSVARDESFQGVLFRVNSPGGSAVGSDMIWGEVKKLTEAGKPVIVSMSDVAGSGGYYVSMAADQIVCHNSTITGSIGVIFGKFDASGFLDWIGVDVDTVKLAPNANFFSLTRGLNPEQEEQVKKWMNQIYTEFVSKAAEGRGLSYEEMESKAHGKIYSGPQALQAQLVDELGGMDKAIDLMAQALDVEDAEDLNLVLYPRPRTLWESLSEGDYLQSWPGILIGALRSQLRSLEVPSLWMLGPEVHIH